MNVMQPCADSEFEWIRTGRGELLSRKDPSWKYLVFNLIPNQFDAYAKILHSIEASYKNIDDPHPLTEREMAILKIPPCTKLRSFVETLRKERRSPRIRWRTLAQLLGVPFGPEICHEWFRASMEEPICWPRFLSGPEDGNLNAEELPEVLSILLAFSGVQDCFFRFAPWPFVKEDKPLVIRGVLDELATFLADKAYPSTPEYWWPANRSWCLCSEYDLKFTIVAGPKGLISAVLNSATLEALEVTPHTRLDDAAPIPR
jgi:hypothetical protein